jgi:hypothetical protein
MSITAYDQLIQRKMRTLEPAGFEPPLPLHPQLFEWQKLAVAWAIRQGRAALFEECGLGKTFQQLEWGRQVCAHTGNGTLGKVLILSPLSVASQTVAEGAHFGYEVTHCRQPEEVRPGLNITNYDRLDLFEDVKFNGVILDESSILKAFNGKTRRKLTDRFSDTPYRLCCTATPAPNDFTELGQHAEFLGVCSPAEMLATYFINDTFDTGTWRLKGHAEEAFWGWVASWAVCITKPSDLGFSDEGFELPELNIVPVLVPVNEAKLDGGELFRNAELSATTMSQEMRLTLTERVAKLREIVSPKEQWAIWCNLNDEQDAIEDLLGNECVSVRGSDREEHKIRREQLWRSGEVPHMVSKGSIFGYGMNWQHCHNVIYFPTYSYEDFHQVIRRFWRFGQKNKVNCYMVLPTTAAAILRTLDRKESQHEQMRTFMRFSREALRANRTISMMNTDITTNTGKSWTLHNGDCVRVAKTIESETIGFSVFSPPFADLFTYSGDIQDMGNCRNMNDFMDQFGFLIDELGRITMPGRECAVHCCDLLATKWRDGDIELKNFSEAIASAFRSRGWLFHSRITIWKSPVTEMQRTKAHGLLYKTLCKDSASSRVGVPDYLLVFRKRGENPKPIEHNEGNLPLSLWQELASPVWMTVNQSNVLNGEVAREDRDERHICPLQLDVINRALTLWSAPDDVVFSPFAGIGSEGVCAVKMGRRFVGAELKRSYWEQACNYLAKAETERVDLFTHV